MSTGRDEFTKETKQIIARRVNYSCSKCSTNTEGPHKKENKYSSIGIAAHITAASVGGPRYDAKMGVQQRKSASNGIWLCTNCSTEIDKNPDKFSTEYLHELKNIAENRYSSFRKREITSYSDFVHKHDNDFLFFENYSISAPTEENIKAFYDGDSFQFGVIKSKDILSRRISHNKKELSEIQLLDILKSGNQPAILFGQGGSGKTTLVHKIFVNQEELGLKIIIRNVFTKVKPNSLSKKLNRLSKENTIWVIYESPFTRKIIKEINTLIRRRLQRVKIILTFRLDEYESYYKEQIRTYSTDKFKLIENLSEEESTELSATLKKHGLIYKTASQLENKESVLLPLIYRLTKGKYLKDHIYDEFDRIESDAAKDIYLFISLLNVHNIEIPDEIFNWIKDSFQFEKSLDRIFLADIIIGSNRYWLTRHRVISEFIVKKHLPTANEQLNLMVKVASNVSEYEWINPHDINDWLISYIQEFVYDQYKLCNYHKVESIYLGFVRNALTTAKVHYAIGFSKFLVTSQDPPLEDLSINFLNQKLAELNRDKYLLLALAKRYQLKDEHDKSETLLLEALDKYIDQNVYHASVYTELFKTNCRAKNYSKAIHYLKLLLTKYPLNTHGLQDMINIYSGRVFSQEHYKNFLRNLDYKLILESNEFFETVLRTNDKYENFYNDNKDILTQDRYSRIERVIKKKVKFDR